jgi:hypothetical protein
MQKTCADSGREFYALGRYEDGRFTLLDAASDMGNNLFDGGEGCRQRDSKLAVS